MNERWQGILKLLKLQSKFALTSLIATTIDISIYSIFIYIIFPLKNIEVGSRQMMIATVVGTSIGMIVNFFLQKKYVFSLKRKTSTAFSLSILVSLGGILLDMLIVGILSRIPLFGLHQILKLVPKFIAKGLIFFYNFFLKRMVFENRTTNRNWQTPTFFALFLLIGLWILPDFGMSWDEPAQRRHGLISWDYVGEYFNLDWEKNKPDYQLETYHDREYGVLFPMTGFALEKALHLETWRAQYLLRHYMVFLLFWVATIFFYKIIRLRFDDWRPALLGVLLLLLSPRIFGHAFFNPKDIVLMSACMISTFTLIKMLQVPTWRTALWHALACAVVINTRIVGILIPAFTVLFLVIDTLQKQLGDTKVQWLNIFARVGLWGVITILLTIVFWPFLWANPLARFQEAFAEMAKFPWEGANFFYGMRMKGVDVPFYYTPAWIVATTPGLYSLLAVLGSAWVAFITFKNAIKKQRFYLSHAEMTDLIALGLFIGPLFIVAVKQSVLYNGWRQMFFVYPPFLLLALTGLWQLWQWAKKVKWRAYIVQAAVAIQLVVVLSFMIPHYNWSPVYFSIFSGSGLTDRFEMDYWGLASKQALEELLTIDDRAKIKVSSAHYPGEINIYFLPEEQRKRLKFVKRREGSDYFLTSYYSTIEHGRFRGEHWPYFPENEVISYDFYGDKILSVYKVFPREEKK